MNFTDEFGITKEEKKTIINEARRIECLGYIVPNITVKFIAHANGVAGRETIYIHPNSNLEELRFAVAHEIGHHNEPEVEFDIWSPSETYDEERKKSEDFANHFAATV